MDRLKVKIPSTLFSPLRRLMQCKVQMSFRSIFSIYWGKQLTCFSIWLFCISKYIQIQNKKFSIFSPFISDLKASDNCGIFVKFKNRNLVKPFLENLQKENSDQKGSNVFKSHIWFIFTEDMENLKLNFFMKDTALERSA